eukprot:gene39834-48503_t
MDEGALKKQKIEGKLEISADFPIGSIPNASIATCRECGETFPSRGKLFRHINFVHKEYGMLVSSDYVDSTLVDRDNIPAVYKLPTVYEDDFCKIISKPQGLPSMGQKGLTVFNHPDIQFKLPNGVTKKCVPAHRLDKETGGLIICGKTKECEIMLKVCLRKKWVQKKYRSLVVGRLDAEEGEVDSPIKGKRGLTRYKVIKTTRSLQGDYLTLVDLWPITGRKHQLRRHMKLIGHPIIGDKRFCPAQWLPKDLSHMCLWAVELVLPSPPQLLPLFQLQYFSDGEAFQQDDATGDQDSDSEDADEDEGGEGKGGREKGLVEVIEPLVAAIDTITVTIPDPPYYDELMTRREKEWIERCGDAK